MMQIKHTLDPKYVFIKLYFINANFINSAEKNCIIYLDITIQENLNNIKLKLLFYAKRNKSRP